MSDSTPTPPPPGDGTPSYPPVPPAQPTPPAYPPAQPGYGAPAYPPPSQPPYPAPGYAPPPSPYGAPAGQVPPAYPGMPSYPGAPVHGAPSPLGQVPVRPLRGIAGATKWLVVASAVLSLLSTLSESPGRSAAMPVAGPADIAALAAFSLAGLAMAAGVIGAMVCWLVWQYRAAASVAPSALRRSPGWHVGSWFIPIIALWFPFQNIKDLTRASGANLSGGIRGTWWALWIANGLISGSATQQMQAATTQDAFTSAFALSVTGDLLWIGAAVLAWIIVTRITDALDPAQR